MRPRLFVVLLMLASLIAPHSLARAEDVASLSALRLRALRLAHHEARRREGYWLLGWGAANTLAGGALAAGFHGSPPAFAASLTSASFGLINALLSFGLLDLSHRQRDAIRAATGTADPAALSRERERAMVAQLRSGQGFALNAGLDIFYIASGALLFGIGQIYGKRWGVQEGAGLAMVGQGAFLLGFDLFAWLSVNQRAEALRALR